MATEPSSTPRPLRPHKEILTAWVLLMLEEGASYGYDLRRELAARQLSTDPAALYRALRKLEHDGWVESRWMKAVAGPRRRFYRLTAKGRRNLDEIAGLIATIRDVHDTFLRSYMERLRARDAAGTADPEGDAADDGGPPSEDEFPPGATPVAEHESAPAAEAAPAPEATPAPEFAPAPESAPAAEAAPDTGADADDDGPAAGA